MDKVKDFEEKLEHDLDFPGPNYSGNYEKDPDKGDTTFVYPGEQTDTVPNDTTFVYPGEQKNPEDVCKCGSDAGDTAFVYPGEQVSCEENATAFVYPGENPAPDCVPQADVSAPQAIIEQAPVADVTETVETVSTEPEKVCNTPGNGVVCPQDVPKADMDDGAVVEETTVIDPNA